MAAELFRADDNRHEETNFVNQLLMTLEIIRKTMTGSWTACSDKNLVQCYFDHHKCHTYYNGINPSLSGDNPTTTRLRWTRQLAGLLQFQGYTSLLARYPSQWFIRGKPIWNPSKSNCPRLRRLTWDNNKVNVSIL